MVEWSSNAADCVRCVLTPICRDTTRRCFRGCSREAEQRVVEVVCWRLSYVGMARDSYFDSRECDSPWFKQTEARYLERV